MLCCKCNKNLAVVYVTRVDPDGTTKNEGYCLTCAQDLNLGPVNDIMKNMGINPEEMDDINREMAAMMDEMRNGDGDISIDFPDGIPDKALYTSDDDDDDDYDGAGIDENMSRSLQQNPLEFMNKIFGGSNENKKDEKSDKSKTDKNKKTKEKSKGKKLRNLEHFGVNLTEKARRGEIDAVIGREREMERTAQVLNRRTKNNPCLIGEPGVGKTAIAEGLALKIVKGDVPPKLLKYEIYMLDMTAVVAGTQFRGQFESRLKNILEEVKRAGNIILVIDEIHTITSAGDAEGSLNAGNILKPALSRGDVQVIGATTIEEYRKHIEKDKALERRFQTVMVEEPTVDETIDILKGIKEYYENYHKVKITDEIIRTAAVLSERYINDRFLPDKAIDVIDEAASRANLENKRLLECEKLKNEDAKIDDEIDALNAKLDEQLEQQRENVSDAPQGNIDTASETDEEGIKVYEQIAELKSRKMRIADKIAELEKEGIDVYLTTEDIAAVIELWTKIPVKNISEFETGRLVNLEERLHTRLIGQDEAVSAVARAIRRKRAGISLKRRPVSFIFVGPTGVGKTELVKRIADEVFDGQDSLIRLDMSEYMEKHSVSKLIGSPPGYVGYDEAGQLTEKVRRHPYSVILLDELEKANADVFNILLQILDDGRITDSHGKTVSFENTIIIMTSNAGSDQKSNIVGFNDEDEAISFKVERALKSLFRPEFLNRVDETVIFKELKRDELIQIIGIMISDLCDGLAEKGISLEMTDAAKNVVLDNSYKKEYGARPMRRYIESHIEDALAQKLIRGELKSGDTAVVSESDGKLKIEIK
ncbi:MAG: ATP-dependent Clp protease ATP-binding subunit [Eubacteriales bacterium]|nr:ATP-dependent Clp protease ATP-binding subunit [Eubacteriales bacterium]